MWRWFAAVVVAVALPACGEAHVELLPVPGSGADAAVDAGSIGADADASPGTDGGISEPDAGAGTDAGTSGEDAGVDAGATYESLDGKKVIFIGNSFIYYGGCVGPTSSLAKRADDQNMFHRICEANGEHVTVYNATYGAHHLNDFTSKGCICGTTSTGCGGEGYQLLPSELDLSTFDYVFMSEAGNENSKFLQDVDAIKARFTNPNTKFIYLVHSYTYYKNHTTILSKLDHLRSEGVFVVEWGKLVYDLARGNAEIAGSDIEYSKNSFIKNKGDTYHPNPLAGYITAQMAYCMVTGRSAVGQDHSFANECTFGGGVVGFDAFISKHYNSPSDTNFVDIFSSDHDMEGIQKLMDRYNQESGRR